MCIYIRYIYNNDFPKNKNQVGRPLFPFPCALIWTRWERKGKTGAWTQIRPRARR